MEGEGVAIQPAIWKTPKLWPRRLLDTSTMTSVECQGGHIYNGVQEPSYSILSYTWGRFPGVQGCPALAVKGLNWDIPIIDEALAFSVTEFAEVIRQLSRNGNRFLWLDVACIDQKNYAAKMEEIGRQAGIFANADRAYVWLWSLTADKLLKAVDPVLKYGFNFGEALLDWNPDDLPSMATALSQGVNDLLRDPWFSSLWTLQEGFLRDDAIFLSREGQPVKNPRFSLLFLELEPDYATGMVTLGDWTWRLRLVYEFLTFQPHGPFHHPDCKDLNAATASRIEETGYVNERSLIPNVQYGMARSRQTTLELDRIYGIMAAYNIQVGAAVPGADAKKKYTLADLEHEFAVAVNKKSALLGQLFVHIRRPNPEKSWMITQNSRVPEGFAIARLYEGQYVTWGDCLIERSTSSEGMAICGVACAFGVLRDYWKSLNKSQSTARFWLSVDDYLIEEQPQMLSISPRKSVMRTSADMEKVLGAVQRIYKGRDISVVKLGRVDIEVPTLPAMVSEESRHTTYGLMILHDEEDQTRCQRLGICKWISEPSPGLGDTAISGVRWKAYKGTIL